MNAVEFHKLLRKAVIYYAAGAPEYTSVMDELSVSCEEEGQWEMVQEALLEADEFMAESDIGTLAQKERIAARRENRQSRYPSCFELDEERNKQIAALAKDVKRQKDARDKRIIQELLEKVNSQSRSE